MTAIRGVLCDIDGTLIDSNMAHAEAFARAFAENGCVMRPDQILPLIGKGGDKLIPELCGCQKESAQFKAISRRHKEIYLQYYVPHLQTTPGAWELLERLKTEHIRIIAATSGEEDVEMALKQVGLNQCFEQKASSQDAPQSKPDPDIVQAALDKAGLHAEEVMMLGDTPYDIEAANRANVPVIAFLTGGWSREQLTGALAVYASPQHLLMHFERSPLRRPGG